MLGENFNIGFPSFTHCVEEDGRHVVAGKIGSDVGGQLVLRGATIEEVRAKLIEAHLNEKCGFALGNIKAFLPS